MQKHLHFHGRNRIMQIEDIYWNSIDFSSEEESIQEAPSMKPYVDPWDLENYAYIRQHLDSADVASDENSDEFNPMSFSYVPSQREQRYVAIDEVRRYNKPRVRRMYSDRGGYRDGFDSEIDENPYEVNMKDVSSPYAQEQDRWRKAPGHPSHKLSRDRSLSFSYGDYGTNQDIYCRLDEIRPGRDSTLPIYDDVRRSRRKPRNFGLSNYGHLKIDYSYSWNSLDKYICN